MSEEKKEKFKPGIISIIALLVGFATFLSGFWRVREVLWFVVYPDTGQGFGCIDQLLILAASLPFPLFLLLFPAGLVLSIIALFKEQNKYYRLLPLAFVLAGAFLFWLGYILAGFWRVN